MTDDIVIRLREKYSGQLPICSEAADEIERLRAMLEEMRLAVISEHRRWCDRPCSAEEWQLHD